MKHEEKKKPTLGSLFAGIGGFDLGFERAGWETAWQVEINPTNRAVLANRFAHARQFEDVTLVGKKELSKVDCITAGFPCQDISQMGTRKVGGRQGLKGKRSGLFWEVLRILEEIQPTWVVLENVKGLLSSNNSEDIQTVIRELAERGYVGFARLLDSQYFGIPQRRERVFLVAGLGRYPTMDFLADAAPVDSKPTSPQAIKEPRPEISFVGNTLTASNAASRINLGGEVLVAEEDGWRAMAERERITELHGFSLGVDEASLAERFAAGNAVAPPVAEWIARKLIASF